MSIKAIAWAWDQELPSSAKLVLLALADCHHPETGATFPSHSYLAKKTGMTTRSVINQIGYLEGHKLLTIRKQYDGAGRQLNNDYLLNIACASEPRSPSGVNGVHPGGVNHVHTEPRVEEPGVVTLPSEDMSSAPQTDADRAVVAYNAAAEKLGLCTCRKLTPDRRCRLNKRLKEYSLDEWNEAMERMAQSPGLCGDNDRGWRAHIDFLLRPGTIRKILEGFYDKWESSKKIIHHKHEHKQVGKEDVRMELLRDAAEIYESLARHPNGEHAAVPERHFFKPEDKSLYLVDSPRRIRGPGNAGGDEYGDDELPLSPGVCGTEYVLPEDEE